MEKKRTTGRRLAMDALSVALVAGLFWYLWSHRSVLATTSQLTWSHAAGISLCVLCSCLLNALQTQIALRLQGIRSGFHENFAVQNAATLANYLPMRAGTAMRFLYFKRAHGLEYSRLGGILAMRVVMLTIATGVGGCIGLLLIRTPATPYLFAAYLGLVAASIVLLILASRRFTFPASALGTILSRFVEGFSAITKEPRVVAMMIALIFAQFFFFGTRLWISFDALGSDIEPASLLLLVPASTLLSFVTVTPGNLGFREWVIGALVVATGQSLTSGVFAAAVDRVVLIACTFILGVPSLFWTWRRLRAMPDAPRAVKAPGT